MSAVYHDFFPLRSRGSFALDDTTTAVDVAVIPVPYKCQVRRVAIQVASSETLAATVTFDQRVLAGSDSGRVTFATVSKPASNQQGKYIYEDPATSVVLNEGDEIVVDNLLAGTSTDTAGTAYAVVLVERWPEHPANQPDMVAG
jgi:hypothetical protein